MSLKIKIEVTSTDLPEYREVNFGTSEIEFDLDDMLKASPGVSIYEKRIGRVIGWPDEHMAFLESVQIIPRARFAKHTSPDLVKGDWS